MNDDQKRYRRMMITTREIFGWSQRDFAKELWVTSGTISNWENGKREIPGPALKLIAMYDLIAKQVQQAVFKKHSRIDWPDFMFDSQIRNQTKYGRYRLIDSQKDKLIKRLPAWRKERL